MRRPWAKMRAKRREAAEGAAFYRAFEEVTGHPPIDTIRGWSNTELHNQLADNILQPAERLAAEEELLDRRAWRGPAGKAVTTSRVALGVSILALVISAWAAFNPPGR